MKVVGVDPAPKKGATVYDPTSIVNGGWSTISACELPGHIAKLADSCCNLLICWDSPLTAGESGKDGCYYERPIERFFQSQNAWLAPKGISVRAYAGCPHWAVTRACVGLPRVGNFDTEQLPFALCADGMPPEGGRYIVEVHPAVAIWLWCQTSDPPRTEWKYKKDRQVREQLWKSISCVASGFSPSRPPKDDDEFDAFVAYLLGSKWLSNRGVELLGNRQVGSFLVPSTKGLTESFTTWKSERER